MKTKYISIVLIATISAYFAWPFSSTIHISQLLRSLPQQEREDLETLCRHLLGKTEFGYTLFGDKPMTCLFLDDGISEFDLRIPRREKLIIYRTLPILKKVLSQLPVKKFILSDYKKDGSYMVYLVNRKAVRKTVLQNIQIFEEYYPITWMSEHILETLLTENTLHKIVDECNSCLLGILLGYGTQNVLNYEYRTQIQGHLGTDQALPWNFLESSKKAALEEELNSIESKQCPSIDYAVADISSVGLPMFLCDPESQETKAIMKKYKKQQRHLQKILSSDTVVAQFLEKLSESTW